VSLGFDGGRRSSNAGVLLLRGVDRKLGVRDELISNHDSTESYCAALRRAIEQVGLPRLLKSLWYY